MIMIHDFLMVNSVKQTSVMHSVCGLFFDSVISNCMASDCRMVHSDELESVIKWPCPDQGTIKVSFKSRVLMLQWCSSICVC
jgi:hypothetical protein